MTEKIKITFLGTSAQVPTAKRNHTGILLTYAGENILVDCGEGIQRQFRIAKLNPCKVDKILITHRHGDHVFGLPGLLSTFDLSGYNRTLHIYGPKGIKKFLESFLALSYVERKFKIKIEEVSGKFVDGKEFYLEAESMEHGIPTNAYSFVLKGKTRIDKNKLKKFKISPGKHLQKLKDGKNISYNGKKYEVKNLVYEVGEKKVSFVLDTLHNKKIVPFVKNSDLLVCEASFDDELSEQAKEHLHLTSKQAGEIAKSAKVKKLVLTHISQRYENKLKILLASAKKVFRNASVAEDFDVLVV